jgi:hypothetical protein
MAWLLVKDGIIVNNIEYDGESHFVPDEGVQLVQTDGPHDIGWAWDGTRAIEPTPPPAPVEPEPAPAPQPTLADLQAQLAALTAQIQALASTATANT